MERSFPRFHTFFVSLLNVLGHLGPIFPFWGAIHLRFGRVAGGKDPELGPVETSRERAASRWARPPEKSGGSGGIHMRRDGSVCVVLTVMN